MKRIAFEDLKSGQKFRHNRKLYIKNSDGNPVQLSNGYVPTWGEFPDDTLVTPVRVKITVVS